MSQEISVKSFTVADKIHADSKTLFAGTNIPTIRQLTGKYNAELQKITQKILSAHTKRITFNKHVHEAVHTHVHTLQHTDQQSHHTINQEFHHIPGSK